MKKYKSLALMLVGALMCGSCSLDEYNPSGATPENVWTSAEGYQQLVNGCYLPLVRSVYGQAEDTYVVISEGGTDLWQAGYGAGNNGNGYRDVQTYGGSYSAGSGQFLESYGGFYSTVNQCNAAIGYVDKVTGLDDATKKALCAEAHFLRAHALFNIVEVYGGKYLSTEPTVDATVTSLPKKSINEFYDVIINDLEYAMENLPATTKETGHVTKGAAYHLYAKACLTYATYTDGKCGATAVTADKAKDLLEEAQTAAEYLINNASSLGTGLYASPDEMFDENNNKTNTECLFRVTHSSVVALNPRGNYFNRVWKKFQCWNAKTSGDYLYLGAVTASYAAPKLAKGDAILCPSKKFLDLFGEKDTRYKAYFQDTYYCNKAYKWVEADCDRYGVSKARVGRAFEIGDTAIYLSRKTLTAAEKENIRYAVFNVTDNYTDEANPRGFWPSLKKFDCPSLYAGTNPSKPYSSADCLIYRLGETYLIAAEAAWRLGNNATALKWLNVIRNRACEGHDGSMNLTSVDKTTLLNEYALEMCGEWNRWETLKRFRAFSERLNAFNPQNASNWKDEYYVRPVPSQEIMTIANPGEYQSEGF